MGDNLPFYVPDQNDAERLSYRLVPKTDIQSEYGSFANYEPICYNEFVRDQDQPSDGKLAWLVLLKVGGSPNEPRDQKTYGLDAKRGKVNETMIRYRRMYTFADMRANGATVVFFENGMEEQRAVLHHVMRCRPGDQIAAIEPGAKVRCMAGDMPIIETHNRLIPAVLPDEPAGQSLLPGVKVAEDGEIGATRFFIIHNATVTLDGVHLQKVCCTNGHMCDFRKPASKSCTCWWQQGRGRTEHVLVGNVKIAYRDKDRLLEMNKVKNWSSQQFTELVYDGRIPLDPMRQEVDGVIQQNIRRNLNRLVDYVNDGVGLSDETKGWTVVGWFKRAARADTSETGAADKQVAARIDDCTMHIVRLTPTTLTHEDLSDNGLLLKTNDLGDNANMRSLTRANKEHATKAMHQRALMFKRRELAEARASDEAFAQRVEADVARRMQRKRDRRARAASDTRSGSPVASMQEYESAESDKDDSSTDVL